VGEPSSIEPLLSGGQVSKLVLKGLSDYYSNEIAVEAARREASVPNKRATLREHLLKERELDNSSKPNRTSAKGC
jgi:hypothetical protein